MKNHDTITQQNRKKTSLHRQEKGYTFLSARIVNRTIVKTILAILTFFLVTIIAVRPAINQNRLDTYRAVIAFYEIDNIAHQAIDKLVILDPELTAEEKIFNDLDIAFHSASTLNEKYKTAKKLDEFIEMLDEKVYKLKDIDPDIAQKFSEINIIFSQIR